MKKVIVKMRTESRKRLVEKLKEMELSLSEPVYLHDRVYVPRNYKPNANYARMILRTEMKEVGKTPKYHLILKRHIADSGLDIVNSSEIRDYAEVSQMIHQLGFEKQAEVSRQREALKLSEGEWLYVDKVEKVNGFYVKLEKKVGDDDWVMEIREELLKTFAILGEKTEVKETYAELEGRE